MAAHKFNVEVRLHRSGKAFSAMACTGYGGVDQGFRAYGVGRNKERRANRFNRCQIGQGKTPRKAVVAALAKLVRALRKQ